MAKEYSEILSILGTEFVLSFAAYHAIFWRVFDHFSDESLSTSPKDCLGISSYTISTINAIVVSLPSAFDFFYFRRWQYPTIDEPKLAAHILYEYILYEYIFICCYIIIL